MTSWMVNFFQVWESSRCSSLEEVSLLKLFKVMLVVKGQKPGLLKMSLMPWRIVYCVLVKTLQFQLQSLYFFTEKLLWRIKNPWRSVLMGTSQGLHPAPNQHYRSGSVGSWYGRCLCWFSISVFFWGLRLEFSTSGHACRPCNGSCLPAVMLSVCNFLVCIRHCIWLQLWQGTRKVYLWFYIKLSAFSYITSSTPCLLFPWIGRKREK